MAYLEEKVKYENSQEEMQLVPNISHQTDTSRSEGEGGAKSRKVLLRD